MRTVFYTTIGDDVEVTVHGSYDRPDKSVGYSGSFEVDGVYLSGNHQNIDSLLSRKQLERLEEEGIETAKQQKDDAKLEAAEARYQANLEYQRFLKEGG